MECGRVSRRFVLLTLVAAGAATACAESAAAPTEGALVTTTVRNALDVEVIVGVGTTAYGMVSPGASLDMAVPARTAQLQWRSRKRQFSNGAAVPDDLEGGALPLAGDSAAVEVTNVVGGVTYVTPVVASVFPDTVALELVQGTTARCLGWQWGATPVGIAWGYYRLDAGTQLRLYRGARCEGRTRAWTSTQLGAYAPRTGRVVLLVDQLP
jgi:hypothetical protein